MLFKDALPFDAMYKGPSSYQYRSNFPDFFVLSARR
jgi:hypothetical protein